MTTLRLTVTTGPQAGTTLDVIRPMIIGGEGGDLRVTDVAMAPRHAQVRPVPAGLEIADLETGGGTWVNGERITRPVVLVAGDMVRLGATEVQVGVARPVTAVPAGIPALAATPSGGDILPPYATDMTLGRRAPASRQPAAMIVCFAVIIATALALITYFATR